MNIIALVYVTFEQIRHCQGLCRAVSIFQTLDCSSLKFGTAINMTLIVVEIRRGHPHPSENFKISLVHSMWTVKTVDSKINISERKT